MRATSTGVAWPPQVPPPTLSERRNMKKAAQPEHSYTGYIPKWLQDPEETNTGATGVAPKRNAPILGYSGHLRHEEDRVGTTFSKGLAIAQQQMAAPAGPLSRSQEPRARDNQAPEPSKRVAFAEPREHPKVSRERTAQPAVASASNRFNVAGDDGDFQDKPMPERSGYGAFDGASGYGEFQAKPMSSRSGYGAFDGASGYGEFQAKPMSSRSRYGAFDGASGYGDFQTKPMSARSGYGDFDGASGYGEFQAKPMSARSGYGEFDNASGYGEFQAKPMSSRSGYGEFDGASGYGAFLDRPEVDEEVRSPCDKSPNQKRPTNPLPVVIKINDDLDRQYQRALRIVGGTSSVHRLLDAFGATIARRHHKRTELIQTIKRHFEKHEQQNQGKMTEAQLKDALQGLSCVFTDEQIMAMMSLYDPECRGYVSMDAILTDITRRAIS